MLIALSFFSNVSAQGLNIGFGAGTELPRLELGYSLNQRIHLGAYFSPGYKIIFNNPNSYGLFGRFTFKKNEIMDNQLFTASIRPYLGANIGILHRAAYEDIYSLNSGGTVPAKTQFGGSIIGGAEILYGKKASYGTFIEGHIGQCSNIYQTWFNNLNSALGSSTPNTDKIASVWGFLVGFRFYFNQSKE